MVTHSRYLHKLQIEIARVKIFRNGLNRSYQNESLIYTQTVDEQSIQKLIRSAVKARFQLRASSVRTDGGRGNLGNRRSSAASKLQRVMQVIESFISRYTNAHTFQQFPQINAMMLLQLAEGAV
ncbi:hypothetical protein AVEN_216220-1 [Araneus ventricosus]|uniref:Uncharacterized protein n=1 Tax=Araneus ventricosus TaxID=182803 RepID=A0A4Y2T1I8_ARAVE|nr:hypothetical protein AVEN_216220-1 [Araneus ventricosus]